MKIQSDKKNVPNTSVATIDKALVMNNLFLYSVFSGIRILTTDDLFTANDCFWQRLQHSFEDCCNDYHYETRKVA